MAEPWRMPRILAPLRELFSAAISRAFPELPVQPPAQVLPCSAGKARFGDYQCNNAMGIYTALRNLPDPPPDPRHVAQRLIRSLPPSDMFGKLDVAGAGFINITISQDWINRKTNTLCHQGIAIRKTDAPEIVAIDYSAPNVAKDLHVGHLRSTIIGDFVGNVLEVLGHDVRRINHIGDWGTQFGMLISHLKETFPDFATNMPPISDLQAFYKAAKARFEQDEAFKELSRAEVVRLQSGDPDSLLAWNTICAVSHALYAQIYAELGTSPKLEIYGESKYNDAIPGIVQELEQAGIIEVSDGAKVIFPPGYERPLIIVKSGAGGYGYDTTDVATIKHRLQNLKATRLIYVTDAGQFEHFKMVWGAARRAGWLKDSGPGAVHKVEHIGFGLVLGADGKRFRSSAGESVRLIDLIDESKARALAELKARVEAAAAANADDAVKADAAPADAPPAVADAKAKGGKKKGGKGKGGKASGGADDAAAVAALLAADDNVIQDEEAMKHAASVIGTAALKYYDLRHNTASSYKFSWDHMLQLNGNSAVFLLYAYARLASIVRRGGLDMTQLRSDPAICVLPQHPSERALALHLLRFQDVMENIAVELQPNLMTDYVYELAGHVSNFYRDCKVLGTAEEKQRLMLIDAVRETLRVCFRMMAVVPLEQI